MADLAFAIDDDEVRERHHHHDGVLKEADNGVAERPADRKIEVELFDVIIDELGVHLQGFRW